MPHGSNKKKSTPKAPKQVKLQQNEPSHFVWFDSNTSTTTSETTQPIANHTAASTPPTVVPTIGAASEENLTNSNEIGVQDEDPNDGFVLVDVADFIGVTSAVGTSSSSSI